MNTNGDTNSSQSTPTGEIIGLVITFIGAAIAITGMIFALPENASEKAIKYGAPATFIGLIVFIISAGLTYCMYPDPADCQRK
jgi:hypothetical protein